MLSANCSYNELIDYLNTFKDDKYRDFSSSLILGDFNIIGIRLPILKSIAKEISKQDYKMFLNLNDNNIFEVKILKAFVISYIKDIDEYKECFDKFIYCIDNWSICDSFIMNSKIIKKDKEYFLKKSLNLIKTNKKYLNRVGFVIILDYFVEEDYLDLIYKNIDTYKSDYYYSNMALAWLVSVLYIKYPNKTQNYLSKCHLAAKVIKKAIRKIKDSYRVSNEDKNWLKKIS